LTTTIIALSSKLLLVFQLLILGGKIMEYMSREDYCEENCGKENREGYKTCTNCGMLNVPSADVQPVRGKWIIDNDYYTCSRCNHQYLKNNILSMTIYPSGGIPHYCPCCGADMRGDT
jgi:hypothetical protein